MKSSETLRLTIGYLIIDVILGGACLVLKNRGVISAGTLALILAVLAASTAGLLLARLQDRILRRTPRS